MCLTVQDSQKSGPMNSVIVGLLSQRHVVYAYYHDNMTGKVIQCFKKTKNISQFIYSEPIVIKNNFSL